MIPNYLENQTVHAVSWALVLVHKQPKIWSDQYTRPAVLNCETKCFMNRVITFLFSYWNSIVYGTAKWWLPAWEQLLVSLFYFYPRLFCCINESTFL